MPNRQTSSSAPADHPGSALVHLRVAVVRMRAQCRTTTATLAELRDALSFAGPSPAAHRISLLNRVNHDLASLARTSAEIDALVPLASKTLLRDIRANRRARERMEREIDSVADIAGDLRIVRRSESIVVSGPAGSPLTAVVVVAAIERTTAVFRVIELRPAAAPAASRHRRPAIRRPSLRDLAAALMLLWPLAKGA